MLSNRNHLFILLLLLSILSLQGCSKNKVSYEDFNRLEARVEKLEKDISNLREQVTNLSSSLSKITSTSTPVETRKARFKITWPKDGETVFTSPDGVIIIKGFGAIPDSKIEVNVRTDTWYPQDNNVSINIDDDGEWTFSPCYLKGTGYYRTRHAIRARLITPDGKSFSYLVENVTVQER